MLGGLRTPPEWNNQRLLLVRTARTRRIASRTRRSPPQTSVAATTIRSGSTSEAPAKSNLNRVLGNVDLNWEPADWLKIQETAGADYYTDSRLEALPLGNSTTPVGQVIRADYNNYILDHNLTAIASHTFSPSFTGTFTLGQNLNATDFSQIYVLGTGLIAPKPFEVLNTVSKDPNDSTAKVRRESYFGQATADLWDQLFLTGAIRNDGFSTFGSNNRRHWFPKASAAWTFTKAISGLTDKIDFGKVRVAYGETGREPLVVHHEQSVPRRYVHRVRWRRVGYPAHDLSGAGRAHWPERRRQRQSAAGENPRVRRRARLRALQGMDATWAFRTTTRRRRTSSSRARRLRPAASSRSSRTPRRSRTRAGRSRRTCTRFAVENFNWNVGLVWGRNRNLVTNLSGSTDILVGSQAILTTVARVGFPTGSFAGFDFVRCGRGLTVGDDNIDAGRVPGQAERNAVHWRQRLPGTRSGQSPRAGERTAGLERQRSHRRHVPEALERVGAARHQARRPGVQRHARRALRVRHAQGHRHSRTDVRLRTVGQRRAGLPRGRERHGPRRWTFPS